MPSNQSTIIEQAKFTFSPLDKAFEKQIKTIKDQGIKQIEAFKGLKLEVNQELESIVRLFSKKMKNIKIKDKIDEIKQMGRKN